MNKNKIFSKTPYNFIPLNKKVLTKDVYDKNKGFSQCLKRNIYDPEKLTGTISLNIKNETPLFIGSRKVDSINHKGFKEICPFKINDKPAIPGSSLRGMLYNLYEITSFSPMVNMEDIPVYFRSSKRDFGGRLQLKFGILSYQSKDSKYVIYDLENGAKVEPLNCSQPFSIINKDNYLGLSSGWFKGVNAFGVKKVNLNFKEPSFFGDSVQQVVKDYQNDKNRDVGIDIISKSKYNSITDKNDIEITGCPIWFSVEGNVIKSIGSSKYHRFPAENRTKDMLPKDHRDAFDHRNDNRNQFESSPYPLSLTEIMFGTSETHSSKLRFTDALCIEGEFESTERLLKPLLSPKIKSANLYLKSKDYRPNWERRKDGQELRGFKTYYNKSSKYKWYDEQVNDSKKNLQAFIKPVKEGAKFESYIHFENLSREELGCLLFALKLKDDLRHSLGMGKPYGLGRIKMNIGSLKIFEIANRYADFDSQSVESVDKIEEYINNFETYILKEIGETEKNSLWDLERFRNLEGLTMTRPSSEDKKIEYMEDYKPFAAKNQIIDDPVNLSRYTIYGKNPNYLEKKKAGFKDFKDEKGKKQAKTKIKDLESQKKLDLSSYSSFNQLKRGLSSVYNEYEGFSDENKEAIIEKIKTFCNDVIDRTSSRDIQKKYNRETLIPKWLGTEKAKELYDELTS